jgi:DNA-binding response OmpR family regulator
MNDVKKVLVVDDDIGIREIIKLILDDEGYEVNELDNGHQVDNAIACWVPDVILLDVMLGDMDGRDICRHLKSEKNTAAIPIIIISATHNRYTLPQKNCSANDYLEKPFDIDDLIRKVKFYARS